jgi:alkylated DNA repair dioxygenase AlkB
MGNPFEEIYDQGRRWTLNDAGIELVYDADFFPAHEADRLFATLRSEIPWRRVVMQTPDGPKTVPRMISWHADAPLGYTYGTVSHAWQDWTPALLEVRSRLEEKIGVRFNGVLANFYENERDSVSPHADDERDMVAGAPIASVSLGCVREFVVRHMISRARHVIPLEHGSLLVMSGDTQKVSRHSIPKAKRACDPRVNLTFRIAQGN